MKLNVNRKLATGTNLLDIDVPEALERSVATKLRWWDDAMGGDGMTPSCSMLFTGTPGAGKTTLMMQLADSITGAGHVCLYNSHEESVIQLRKTARRLQLKNGFVVGNDRLVPDIITHAKALQKSVAKSRTRRGAPKQVFLIIDSLQAVDDGMYKNGHTNMNTSVRVTEMVTNWCKEENHGGYGIGIIIGQVNKAGEFSGKNTIKHAVDAHAHLSVDKDTKSVTWGQRMLDVPKNRFGAGCDGQVLCMTKSGLKAYVC